MAIFQCAKEYHAEFGVLMMNKRKNKEIIRRYTLLIAVLLLIVFCFLGYFVYQQHLKDKGKSAPIVSEIKEQLDQAKALQKQGKLVESAEVFEQFALQGYPDAMFYLAKSYEKGWGMPPDLEKARSYLLNAITYDFSYRGESAYQLGRLFQKSAGPDCNTLAVDWFKKALKWNYIKASLALGTHYEKGLGVERDYVQAIYYYEIASREDIAIAALKHARLIMQGEYGIAKDTVYAQQLVDIAVIRLTEEALAGKASSAKSLGRLYRNNQLVNSFDEQERQERTIKWFRLASDLGDAGAMHDLGRFLLFVNEESNQKEAIALLKKSANKGHGGAATALGRMHLAKKYGFKRKGAVAWFEKGVKAGHTSAFKELANLYYKGELINKDLDMAIILAQKGANRGDSGSKKLLNKFLKKRKQQQKRNKKKQLFAGNNR